jgi:signal peptidase
MMKTIALIYEKIIWALTIVLILAAVIVSAPKVIGIYPYIILSASMEPTIRTGSLVYINTKDQQISVGDIVTFYMTDGSQQINVTHRVARITEEGIVTKGDNNEVEDLNLLTPDRVIGKYAFHIPGAGYLMARMTERTRLVVIIWMIALHVFGFALDALAETFSGTRKSKASR